MGQAPGVVPTIAGRPFRQKDYYGVLHTEMCIAIDDRTQSISNILFSET